MEQAPRPRPGEAAALPLLELPPGVVSEFVVPRLRPRQRAALSLTCKALRRAVAGSVKELTLPGGRCCPAVRYQLHEAFPAASSVAFTPSNLHEAMNIIPSLLMTMAAGMPSLSRVSLHDKLPDEPAERRKCATCSAWRNTYDLAAIVFTVHGCLAGRLREFDFSTHYISHAECMAIGNMTALTSLRCCSPHGFSAGGLAAFSRLVRLRRLEITDAPRGWSEEDVEAVVAMTALTRLALGGNTSILRPLLRRMAEAAGCGGPPEGAGGAEQPAATPAAFGLVGGPAAPAAAPAARAGGCADDDGGGCGDEDAEEEGPLKLLELSVVFDWIPSSNADLVAAIAQLSSLTSLTIGWLGQSANVNSTARRTPLRSCSTLAALSALRRLRELDAGWPVDREVFDALAPLRALTALTLGTLPLQPPAAAHHAPAAAGGAAGGVLAAVLAGVPNNLAAALDAAAAAQAAALAAAAAAAAAGGAPVAAPPAPPARLLRVKRLTVSAVRWLASRHPWHEVSTDRQRLMGLDGSHSSIWVEALPAFPNLESLTLDAGAARPTALRRIPEVAPRLRELRLPPRLDAGPPPPGAGGAPGGAAGAPGGAAAAAAEAEGALRALGRLSALTSLAIGWKAALHEGPPMAPTEASLDGLAKPEVPLSLNAVFCRPPAAGSNGQPSAPPPGAAGATGAAAGGGGGAAPRTRPPRAVRFRAAGRRTHASAAAAAAAGPAAAAAPAAEAEAAAAADGMAVDPSETEPAAPICSQEAAAAGPTTRARRRTQAAAAAAAPAPKKAAARAPAPQPGPAQPGVAHASGGGGGSAGAAPGEFAEALGQLSLDQLLQANAPPPSAVAGDPSATAAAGVAHPAADAAAASNAGAAAAAGGEGGEGPLFAELWSLEVSGPAHPAQIGSLSASLPPKVTELIVSDNPSWSTGLDPAPLLAAACAPGLRRLAVRRCRGLDGSALEAALLRARGGGALSAAGGADPSASAGHADARGLALDLDFDFEPCAPPAWPHADRGGAFHFMMAPAGPAGGPGGGGGGGGGGPWWVGDGDGFGGGNGGGPEDDWLFQFPGFQMPPPLPPPPPLGLGLWGPAGPPPPPPGGAGGGGGGGGGGELAAAAGGLAGAAAAAAALQQQAAALQAQAAAAQQQLANFHEQLGLPPLGLPPPGLLGPVPGGLPLLAAGAANVAAANAAVQNLFAALAPQQGGGGGGGGGGGAGGNGAGNAAAAAAAVGALAAVLEGAGGGGGAAGGGGGGAAVLAAAAANDDPPGLLPLPQDDLLWWVD